MNIEFTENTETIPCETWDGRTGGYQNEAIRKLWVEKEVEVDSWEWVSTVCDTPYCIELSHLEVSKPVSLKYPRHLCVYCGHPGYTRDHLLPLPWTGKAKRRHVLTVWACGTCNSIISDHPASTITARRAVAQRGLGKKFKTALNYKEYTEEELEEFGEALRSSIIEGLELKRDVEIRLAWPHERAFDYRYLEQSGYPDPHTSGLLD